jgi:dynein heavy chain
VPPSVLRKLGRYTSAEGFDPETVRKSSGAAAALCTWVRAIELYCTVSKDVEPKRQALKAAEAALAEKTALLGKAREELALVVARVAELNEAHARSVAQKTALALEATALGDKLTRAEALLAGLSGERLRWEAAVGKLDAALACLPGDALLGAAFLAYCGPCDGLVRAALLRRWTAALATARVPLSPDFSPVAFLATAAAATAGGAHSRAPRRTLISSNRAAVAVTYRRTHSPQRTRCW